MVGLIRGGRVWDPWRDLADFRNELNRVFAGQRSPLTTERVDFPPVNVYSGEEALIVTATVPGFGPEDLDITVKDNTVTIKGQRDDEQLSEGESWRRHGRFSGQFAKTIELPTDVDPKCVEATLEKGILTLKLHHPEEKKPHKVAIKAG